METKIEYAHKAVLYIDDNTNKEVLDSIKELYLYKDMHYIPPSKAYEAIIDDFLYRAKNKITCFNCGNTVLGVDLYAPYCPYCGWRLVGEIQR